MIDINNDIFCHYSFLPIEKADTLIIFVMVLYIILRYLMLMLVSTLFVIWHLNCGNRLILFLDFNLTYKTLNLARKKLNNFNAGKLKGYLCYKTVTC